MKVYKIVILGSGAHAAELEGYIEENNRYLEDVNLKIVGYCDDNKEQWKRYKLQAPHLGGLKTYSPKEGEQFLLGVNNINLREDLVNIYKAKGAKFHTFIHHSCFVFNTASLGEGNILTKNCTIGPNASLGNYNTLNTYCSIGHDSIIGNNNVLCPHTGFSGNTKIGHNNFFGLNVNTFPSIEIGSSNVLSAGIIVDKNVSDNSTIYYRFKEKVFVLPKE